MEIVKIFLSNNADLNANSGVLGSPIQAAITGGYSSIVEILIALNAKLDRKSNTIWADAFKVLERVPSSKGRINDRLLRVGPPLGDLQSMNLKKLLSNPTEQ